MQHRAFALTSMALSLSLFATTDAAATAQRTFVASTGADTNASFNCSIAKPCRGFAAAIGVTSAGGEVVVLDSAGYGPFTITQSVSIISPAGVYAGISVTPAQDGVTIATPGVNVLLRGLVINGQGGHDGVIVNAANVELHVEACTISGLVNDGLNMNSAGGTLFIRDSIFRDNAGVGMSMTGVIGNVDRSRIEHNGSDGVGIGQDSWATITDSIATKNSGNGIIAYNRKSAGGGTTQLTVQGSSATDNGLSGIDGEATSGSAPNTVVVSVTRSVVSRNLSNGIQVLGQPTHFAYLAAAENTIDGNSNSGIAAICNSVNASVIVTNNVVTRNTNGLAIDAGCGARSLGNNLVERNTNDFAGGSVIPTIVLGK